MSTPEANCDGSRDCAAAVHVHGCFADGGKCDEPTEHALPGRSAGPLAFLEAHEERQRRRGEPRAGTRAARPWLAALRRWWKR